MHFSIDQETSLRQWMMCRFDTFKDVGDPDILTDLIFTILKSDGTLEKLRDEVRQSFDDILEEETTCFVEDLFEIMSQATPLKTDVANSESAPVLSLSSPRKRQHDGFGEQHTPAWQRGFRYDPDRLGDRRCSQGAEPGFKHRNTTSRPSTIPRRAPRGTLSRTIPPPKSPTKTATATTDPEVAIHSTQQLDFQAMQRAFPYLTQMWLNNRYMQEHIRKRQSSNTDHPESNSQEQSNPKTESRRDHHSNSIASQHTRVSLDTNNYGENDDEGSASRSVDSRDKAGPTSTSVRSTHANDLKPYTGFADIALRRAELARKSAELQTRLEAEKKALVARTRFHTRNGVDRRTTEE